MFPVFKPVFAAYPELESCSAQRVNSILVHWLFRGFSIRELGVKLSAVSGLQIKASNFAAAIHQDSNLLRYKIEILNSIKTAPINVEVKKYLRRFAPASKLDSVVKIRSAIILQIGPWVRRFVSRKMRFILQQRQGVTLDDLYHDIVCKSIQGFNVAWPLFDSMEHAVNTVKRIAHNSGINLIKRYSTKKMSALVKEGDNFVGLVSSLSSLSDVPVEHDRTLEIDVSMLKSRYTGKRRTFVRLISGEYSKKFSLWLKEPNDEAFERWGFHRYLTNVSKYLNVSTENANKFLATLRKELYAYSKDGGASPISR